MKKEVKLFIMSSSRNRIYLVMQRARTKILSVRKVVPTLTSKSAEIYLSMVGAKQLVTRGLS
jgi:hypothetical protein